MAFNGSGTYSLPAGNPVVTGTTISSSTTNTTNSDIATALTNCITRDGQSTPSANLPMNAKKLTGLAAGTSAGDSVRYEQIQYINSVASAGTSGQVLTSAGTGAPTWTTPTSPAGYLPLAGGTMTGAVNLSSTAINTARSSVAQHATTMDFWAAAVGNVLDGTGAGVTITAIANAPQAGASRDFYPITGTILTQGATFNIDGAVTRTSAAGECWTFVAKSVSTYRVFVRKADGTAVVAGASTAALGASLALLATLTPTAANAVDALTVFTSDYDVYLIIGEGIKPSSDDFMRMKFANAGVVDSNTVYCTNFGAASNGVAAGAPFDSEDSFSGPARVYSADIEAATTKGAYFRTFIYNTNDAANMKTHESFCTAHSAANDFRSNVITGAYTGAAVSGVRFYWGGANFQATGTIRIYGIKNA